MGLRSRTEISQHISQHQTDGLLNILVWTSLHQIMVILLLLLLSSLVTSQNPDQSSGLVQKLISQRNTLIQPGLSFINSSNYFLNDKLTVRALQNTTNKYKVGCVINLE